MSKKLTKGLSVMNGKTKNLSQEKFEFVKDLYILQNMKYTNVVKAFVAKFGDTDRSARGYITKVKKALKDTTEDELGYHMNSALLRFQDLYHKAYADGKWSECKDIQKEINKLTGLDVKRVEINSTVNNNTVDVNKLIAQLPADAVAQMVAALNKNKNLPPTIDITPDVDD